MKLYWKNDYWVISSYFYKINDAYNLLDSSMRHEHWVMNTMT